MFCRKAESSIVVFQDRAPITCKRLSTAKFQKNLPVMAGNIVAQHLFMIAHQGDHLLPLFFKGNEDINDLTGIRAPVNIITQEYE